MQITSQTVDQSIAGAVVSDEHDSEYLVLLDDLGDGRSQASVYSVPDLDPLFACELELPYHLIERGSFCALSMMRGEGSYV